MKKKFIGIFLIGVLFSVALFATEAPTTLDIVNELINMGKLTKEQAPEVISQAKLMNAMFGNDFFAVFMTAIALNNENTTDEQQKENQKILGYIQILRDAGLLDVFFTYVFAVEDSNFDDFNDFFVLCNRLGLKKEADKVKNLLPQK